jgi:hypothetical protein
MNAREIANSFTQFELPKGWRIFIGEYTVLSLTIASFATL